MKRIMLICAFIAVYATQAQEDSAYRNTAIEFVKLSSDKAMFDTAIDQLGNKVTDAKKKEFRAEAKTTLNGLYANMAELFMAEFSHDELKDLVRFYKTDLGKKFALNQMRISQKAMRLGVSWGHEIQMVAEKYTAQ